MATLHFSASNVKVFTPISSALANLPNGPGTIVVLVKQVVVAPQDYCGLMDAAGTDWFHGLSTTVPSGTGPLFDDTGLSSATGSTAQTGTNWRLFAVDWGSSNAVERFHFRDQTALSAWTHENSGGTNGGLRAGPGTSGWFRLGYILDHNAGGKDMAVVAVWAGTRFADGDYGSWTKTSDLYSHSNGAPTFLCQLNVATLVDLIGGSTFSSANSSGTTLTGADPDNWTMDGVGSGGGSTDPAKPALIVPNQAVIRANGWW